MVGGERIMRMVSRNLTHWRRHGEQTGVLLVGPLPPPPGGVESLTQLLWESPLRTRYNMHLLNIQKTRGKEYTGRIDWRNTRDAAGQLVRCGLLLRRQRPKVFHTNISA